MLRLQQTEGTGVVAQPLGLSSSSVLLSEAVAIYLRLKGQGRPATFQRAAERACGYVIDACGDKHLEAHSKADANSFRDALIARGLAGSSMTRVFGTVRAVTNFAASEQGFCKRQKARRSVVVRNWRDQSAIIARLRADLESLNSVLNIRLGRLEKGTAANETDELTCRLE